ncbi:hypothetical protein RHSIM_Rhsim10G0163000 [Rhododendron simsii]|uniref:Oxidation resistance protein 1 n=1 Tax=Rhododendron simsii TaxID=118357 RepID=A0A834GES2_RHOSS|nr:hypothetical protein RHSIM_Rhsim10G0163000 [Rhododendron simsii]
MGRKQIQGGSLRSKAAHFVSDVTTVFLNPISDKPSTEDKHPQSDDETETETNQLESVTEEGSSDSVDEPDTSSFTAFLYSLLSSSKSGTNSNPEGQKENQEGSGKLASDSIAIKESSGKRSLFSRGKQSIGRALYQAARLGGYRNQASGNKGSSDMTISSGNNSTVVEDVGIPLQMMSESVDLDDLPEISEPSLLLTEKTRSTLYHALPVLVRGRNWVLLYSTWRHGISLATLYRRSMLCPGLSMLVVGDRKGAVFGGLVEAPLRATNKRKYQGTNDSFVFTNTPGHPVIFWPTGINRYFTLCSTEFLALGGGSHFALYLDGDLLNGSSSASDTYGNSCLACSEDFEVKEIELWGFVYASKYEEMISLLRTETPGIARW